MVTLVETALPNIREADAAAAVAALVAAALVGIVDVDADAAVASSAMAVAGSVDGLGVLALCGRSVDSPALPVNEESSCGSQKTYVDGCKSLRGRNRLLLYSRVAVKLLLMMCKLLSQGKVKVIVGLGYTAYTVCRIEDRWSCNVRSRKVR